MTATGRKDGAHEITFGRHSIPFELEFRDRQRLAISVHPDRSVTVVAPRGRPLKQVLDRVQKRAAWIVKQRAYFETFHPLTPPRRYVSGETHLYLGRQYRLKLFKRNDACVKLVGRFFQVSLSDRKDAKTVQRLLDGWYRDHAKLIFARRLETCLESARSLDVSRPELVIRKMAKRWGSCTRFGRILLNTELIKTPLYCIEYVIMHELCHLRFQDHSPRFYQLLGRFMPDWQRRKERLEVFVL